MKQETKQNLKNLGYQQITKKLSKQYHLQSEFFKQCFDKKRLIQFKKREYHFLDWTNEQKLYFCSFFRTQDISFDSIYIKLIENQTDIIRSVTKNELKLYWDKSCYIWFKLDRDPLMGIDEIIFSISNEINLTESNLVLWLANANKIKNDVYLEENSLKPEIEYYVRRLRITSFAFEYDVDFETWKNWMVSNKIIEPNQCKRVWNSAVESRQKGMKWTEESNRIYNMKRKL